MNSFLLIIVILAYLSLLVELLFFPVPSVASTYQLAYKANESSEKTEETGKVGVVKEWSFLKKIFLLILPATINILVFIAPLIIILCFQGLVQKEMYLLILGILLIILGRGLTFYAAINIRRNNKQEGVSFELKEKGIFAKSRNPILMGMHLMIIGLLLLTLNYLLLVGVVFYLGYMHFKVLLEEDFLQLHFGNTYLEYKNLTRRYL